MKIFFIASLILGIFTITAGCATVEKAQLSQLETQIKKQKYKNDELAVKIFQLEQTLKQQQTDAPRETTPPLQATPIASKKSEMAEKKDIPQPVAPVRPAFKAYIDQQIASGPHVVEIKNATNHMWLALEINGRPVNIIKNGFPIEEVLNEILTNQGVVSLLPPRKTAYLILEKLGTTLITARNYTGIATPLQFQKERTKTYNFNARAEPYQRSIWSRWDF